MVLLAGDLFHDNKPSRKAMYQVIRTLRQNCLGMKPCELEFLSDATEIFEGAFGHVNYEDPHFNIGIPVFTIHGNHDDPAGVVGVISSTSTDLGSIYVCNSTSRAYFTGCFCRKKHGYCKDRSERSACTFFSGLQSSNWAHFACHVLSK